jgi:hypothetical protein
MYRRGNRLVTQLADVRADLPEILDAVRAHTLRPELVTSLVTPWADAPQALLEPGTKVIVCLR